VEGGSWVRVLELASRYGYAFLFLISIAENTFLLGLVVPGDVAVVLGGALSASGRLDVVRLAAVVIFGVMLGAGTSFFIGRRGGIPLIERSAARFSIAPSTIEGVELYFARHGAKTVFLASFVSGLKNLVPAVAGASRMSAPRFFAYSAAGSTARGLLLIGIGYAFGASVPHAVEIIGRLNAWIVVGFIVLLVVFFVRGWRKGRRRARESGEDDSDRVDRGAS
jgi:membrane protein DedA with SNARE-associated domain